jgi:cytochrome c oxidase subunit 2
MYLEAGSPCFRGGAYSLQNKLVTMNKKLLGIMAFLSAVTTFPALADQPHPKQLGLQAPASPVMEQIVWFHNDLLMPIITAIVIFVAALLIYVMVRFNAKANPEPSNTTHNVPLEIVWTIVPVIILIIIAIPSFRLLYLGAVHPEPELTVKATGYQWYWGYEYMDNGGLSFMANMIPDKEIDASKGQVRLLSTDEPIVLPVDTNILFQVTAADVLHAFAVPAFGIKVDAVPGRLNETWVKITKPGVYYGQCSELCGTRHGFMPIEIHAVSKEDFNKWVVSKGGTVKTAAVETDAPAEDAASQE